MPNAQDNAEISSAYVMDIIQRISTVVEIIGNAMQLPPTIFAALNGDRYIGVPPNHWSITSKNLQKYDSGDYSGASSGFNTAFEIGDARYSQDITSDGTIYVKRSPSEYRLLTQHVDSGGVSTINLDNTLGTPISGSTYVVQRHGIYVWDGGIRLFGYDGSLSNPIEKSYSLTGTWDTDYTVDQNPIRDSASRAYTAISRTTGTVYYTAVRDFDSSTISIKSIDTSQVTTTLFTLPLVNTGLNQREILARVKIFSTDGYVLAYVSSDITGYSSHRLYDLTGSSFDVPHDRVDFIYFDNETVEVFVQEQTSSGAYTYTGVNAYRYDTVGTLLGVSEYRATPETLYQINHLASNTAGGAGVLRNRNYSVDVADDDALENSPITGSVGVTSEILSTSQGVGNMWGTIRATLLWVAGQIGESFNTSQSAYKSAMAGRYSDYGLDNTTYANQLTWVTPDATLVDGSNEAITSIHIGEILIVLEYFEQWITDNITGV